MNLLEKVIENDWLLIPPRDFDKDFFEDVKDNLDKDTYLDENGILHFGESEACIALVHSECTPVLLTKNFIPLNSWNDFKECLPDKTKPTYDPDKEFYAVIMEEYDEFNVKQLRQILFEKGFSVATINDAF